MCWGVWVRQFLAKLAHSWNLPLDKVGLASFDLVCGHPACQSLEEHHFQLCLFLCLVVMIFQYCPGLGRSVEKDKLEHVTHLTNYSKLFELRDGNYDLQSVTVFVLIFYITCSSSMVSQSTPCQNFEAILGSNLRDPLWLALSLLLLFFWCVGCP